MKKKSLLLAALSLVMVGAIAVGGTMAYFTAEKTVANTFSVGNVAITLDEAKVTKDPATSTWTADPTAPRVTENKYESVYPGATLPKDPTVTLTAGSSDAYVRVRVVIDSAKAWKAACEKHGVTLEDIFLEHPAAQWSRVSYVWNADDTVTLVYNLNTKLSRAVNAVSTATLFQSVRIPSPFTSAEMAAIGGFSMNLTAEAIQAEGFTDSAAAFAALDAQIAPPVVSPAA
ncbi:MAG: SipW-dependent-type signal peptide-containing protein [Oscillospiraceae bacterium]